MAKSLLIEVYENSGIPLRTGRSRKKKPRLQGPDESENQKELHRKAIILSALKSHGDQPLLVTMGF